MPLLASLLARPLPPPTHTNTCRCTHTHVDQRIQCSRRETGVPAHDPCICGLQACVIDIAETRQTVTQLNQSMTTLVKELNLREMEKKDLADAGKQVYVLPVRHTGLPPRNDIA